MNRFAIIFVCLTFVPCLANPIQAQQAQQADQEQVRLVEAIKEVVDTGFERQELIGLAVRVVRHGEEISSESIGFQDRVNDIPVSSDSMFRWASISKPVTAVAAMILVEEGKLDLDADIRNYVPEFPDKEQVITARQLMCHHGGVVHYRNGRVIRTRAEYSVENPFENVVLALDSFKESPLVCVPGESYNYSTHGYILLSAVVERAAGVPFAQFVDERIATPLEMDSFQPDYQWVEISNRAVGYRKRLGRVVMSSNTDVSWKLGGGGFISNIDDLSRFATAMAAGKLLTEESFQVMWQAQTPQDGKRTNYGLGFGVDRHGDLLRISHSGSQEKTRTAMIFLPESRTSIVAMTNSEYGNPGEITSRILKIVEPLVIDDEKEN